MTVYCEGVGILDLEGGMLVFAREPLKLEVDVVGTNCSFLENHKHTHVKTVQIKECKWN